jgi:hypothetical protein
MATRQVLIVRDPPPSPLPPHPPPIPIGLFPFATPVGPAGPGVGAHDNLASGSIWIFAPLLAAHSPGDSFCGFRIRGGRIALQGTATVVGGVVHIRATDVLTIAVELNPPPQPPAVTGPGADATAAVPMLPARVSIEFRPNGAHITGLSDFGLTAYGVAVALTRNNTAPAFDAASERVFIFADVAPTAFTVASAQSALLALRGSAAVQQGFWALPISTRPVAQLGDARGAGAVGLKLGGGFTAQWTGLPSPQALSSALLLADPGRLLLFLAGAGPPCSQDFQLWNEAATGRRSSITFTCPSSFTLRYGARSGLEGLEIAGGSATAHLDRPVQAGGSRFSLARVPALLLLEQDATGFHVALQASQPASPSVVPLALTNALLRVSPPSSLSLKGSLNQTSVVNGTVTLSFSLSSILPFLPDPYIKTLSVPISVVNETLTGAIAWTQPDAPQLSFSSPALRFVEDPVRGLGLLDVSTNADQLGVFLFRSSDIPPQFVIQGMDFKLTANCVALLTFPEIAWEPMFSDGTDGSLPGSIHNQDDGQISVLVLAESIKLVPIAPALLIGPLLQEANAGSTVTAELTLPFGIFANIRDPKAQYALNQPSFPGGLSGGLQIRMLPPMRQPLPGGGISDPGFLGSAFTRGTPYAKRVLGSFIDNLFDPQFSELVPLLRYDFCGYGASVFSDWRKVAPVGSQVIKAQFNVFIGRTAYEVIQAQSFIIPWRVRVVRTVTIERTNAGGVLRHDSGWQPASDGRFEYPGTGLFQVHAGPITLVGSVRNIREQGSIFTLDGTRHWQAVVFDAEFVLPPELTVTSGTAGSARLTSRDITGYLVAEPGVEATPAEVNALLASRPASGPVAGTISVAGTGASLRASQVAVSSQLTGSTGVIVAALRGSPVLPATGAWSVAKRDTTAGAAPLALDSRMPVPLIRNNAASTWHLAEPSEILRLDSPLSEYGLLQSTGTQKVFFPRPRMIPPAAPPPPGNPGPGFHLPQPPHLADVGALFNAAGLFPDLRAALQFDGATADLQTSADGLEIHGTIDTSTFPPRPLVDFGPVKVLIDYHDENGRAATAHVDITPAGWSISLGRVTFPVITPLGDANDPLLKIIGEAVASSSSAPTLTNLNIVYGGALAPVQNIFANLEQLAKFLPGGGGSFLDVSFSNGRLTIRDVFALPRLPLGAGFLKDIALDIGMTMQLAPQALEFTAGIGSTDKPFQWLVSPLSGTGVIQVGVKDGDLAVLIQAGIGGGLAIDIGIATGSASIVLALQVSVTGSNLSLLVLLTGQASVDVLDGLASVSLTLTAGIGVTPHPFPPRLPPSTKPLDDVTFSAAVGVGIHLTVGWLVHVDFDGYWQFSKTIDVPDIGTLIPI